MGSPLQIFTLYCFYAAKSTTPVISKANSQVTSLSLENKRLLTGKRKVRPRWQKHFQQFEQQTEIRTERVKSKRLYLKPEPIWQIDMKTMHKLKPRF